MRGIFRYFTLAVLATVVVVSCSKFDEESPILEVPTIEHVGGDAYYSTFYLPALWELGEGVAEGDVHDIKLEMLPLANRLHAYNYDALLTAGKQHAVRFLISPDETEDLPSGKYLLRGYSGGERFAHEFVLTFDSRVVKRVERVPDYAKIFEAGDGSEENPFRILNQKGFENMCDFAEKDPSHALGKHFVQIASNIDLPSNMGMQVDEGWYSVDFAGNYNGMGNSISGFAFNGIRDNNAYDIGLFRTLHNGAYIENVVFNTSGMRGIAERGGIVAGSVAEGATVHIKNCKLRGSISDSKGSIGGLVGYANKATLMIEEVDMGMNIECKANNSDDTDNGYRVGGLIGFAIDSYISIKGGEIDLDNLYVEGGWCVGGLIGETRDCEIFISGPELIRSTTKDLKTIVGTEYVGGAIGYLDAGNDKDAEIEHLTIAYPVSGVRYVGGLIGSTNSKTNKNDDFDLELTNVQISSNVIGSEDVGGFIGLIKNRGASGKSDGSCETFLRWYGDCFFGSIDGNKTQVTGDTNVGGLFGKVEMGSRFYDTFYDTSVAATITANSSCAGGLIGYVDDLSIYLDGSKTLPSTKVVAPLYAGGVVGYMNGGYLSASTSSWSADEDGCEVIPTYDNILNSLPNSSVKVECSSSSQYVGGVVGFMASNSEIGTVCTQSEVTGGSQVGGIVGGAIGSNIIIGCSYPNGFVRGSGIEIGGVVGRIEGDVEVTNCINYSSVDGGSTGAEIGGVVGYSKYNGEMPHIHYCVNVGSVTACNVGGGVLGLSYVSMGDYHSTVMVENCANFGKIAGRSNSEYNGSSSGFGGIMGHSSNTQGVQLAHCANHGDMEISCSVHGVGGIVGAIGNDPGGLLEQWNYHVWECANRGNIKKISGDFHVGGIVGYMEEGTSVSGNHACVEGCYNWGDLDCNVGTSRGLGGIAGYLDNHAELWRNANFKKPSGLTGESNTGNIWGDHKLTYTTKYNYYVYDEASMANSGNFSDLNINQDGSFWVMSEGDPHPQIRNCPFQNSTYNPNAD